MPFDGNGNFTPYTGPGAGYPAVPGATILAAQFNNVVADITTGLSDAITRDGQSPPTQNLPMGAKKIVNLADGTVATDAATLGQVRNAFYGNLTGVAGADTITATSGSPAITAYAVGQLFEFVAAADNTTSVTIAISGLAAKAITKQGNIALTAKDLLSGVAYIIYYDGTQFQLLASRPYSHGADVASAATVILNTTTGDCVDITGITGITAITLREGEERTVRFTGALTLTHSANLVLPGAANITTVAGDYAVFRGYATGVVRCTNYVPFGGGSVVSNFSRNYLSGFNITANGASVSIAITAGQAVDRNNTAILSVNTDYIKSQSAWAVGSVTGSLDEGTVASASYSAYVIKRTDTGVTDYLTSLCPDTVQTATMTIASPCVVSIQDHGLQINGGVVFTTTGALPTGIAAGTRYYVIAAGYASGTFQIAATIGGAAINTTGSQSGVHACSAPPLLPASYTLYRRIGYLLNNGISWVQQYQYGDNYYLGSPAILESNTTVPITATFSTPTAGMFPKGDKIPMMVQATLTVAATRYIRVYSTTDADLAVTIDNATVSCIAAGIKNTSYKTVLTDRSGRILWRSDTSATGGYLQILGWVDTRGKL